MALKKRLSKRKPRRLIHACECPTCRQYSRAYLHHLFLADEMLGPTLLSLHNVAFYQRLVAEARRAIEERRYAPFCQGHLARWQVKL